MTVGARDHHSGVDIRGYLLKLLASFPLGFWDDGARYNTVAQQPRRHVLDVRHRIGMTGTFLRDFCNRDILGRGEEWQRIEDGPTRLCLPQIKSGHIGGAAHLGSGDR